MLQEKQASEDIISLDGSIPDMDLVYQHNTSFDDIPPPQHIQQTDYNAYAKITQANSLLLQTNNCTAHSKDTSSETEQHNKSPDVTVTQPP